jgi:hypothetical protein
VYYRKASGAWTPAVVTSVVSQTSATLAIRRSRQDPNYAASPLVAATPTSTGQQSPLNGGAAVAKAANNWASIATTNIWKRY